MSQWLPPGQQGYQYPQQTGYPQQQQLQPQPTGYPGGGTGFLQPQRTGFQGQVGYGGQQQQGGIPPVPPLPGNFQRGLQPQPQQSQVQQFNTGLAPGYAQQGPQGGGFLSPSPGLGGPLTAQPTGYGGQAPLVAQRTGYNDPRLQMMSSTFLPANISAPYAPSGAPQFAGGPQGGQSLQQSFQQVNQNVRGTSAPKIPWALSKDERKNYDQIFRAWDTSNSGFISGEMAQGVFGQSGLDQNDLATIWSLADADNRGKLNIQEFHVAMGLIYRRLNGNDLPSVLPPEMEPVSSKNLGESVDFVKQLLDRDTQITGASDSRGKVHSFRDSPSPRVDPRKDGTIYKHDDTNVKGYASSSRRINRDNVRSSNATPSDDLSDIKRQLATTGDRLDKARAEAESRTAEDEALDQELEDLKYRVRRVQEDIDYVNRGPRSSAKDAERRKLERELNELMYKDVPAVEQKIEDRERRKAREKADWSRDRDRRNGGGRGGRYDASPSRYDDRDSRRTYDDDDEPDRGYLRGTYDRDRGDHDRDRDRERERDRDSRDDYRRRDDDRDRERDRDAGRDREYGRRSSPPRRASPVRARTPAPPPAPAAATLDAPRPPAPAPSASPAPQTKSMTPAERSAFIRQQAQQRLQERMRALGVSGSAPAASSPVDTSVEDRLAQERKEAEEKARQAEKDAADREAQRNQRLEAERGPKAPPAPAASPKPPAPVAPVAPVAAAKAPPPPPIKRVNKSAPPPPSRPSAVARGSAPGPTPPPAVVVRAPAPPRAPAVPVAPPALRAPVAPEEDEEDRIFREREEALKKKRAARQAELERLEAEAATEDEEYQARLSAARQRVTSPPAPATNGRSVTPLAPPIAVSLAPPVAAPSPPVAAPAPPAPPPQPVAAPVASPPEAARTNPFHKLAQQGSAAPSPVTAPSTNPWATAPAAAPAAPPPPPAPPAPPVFAAPTASKGPASKPFSTADLDDWDDPVEKDDEDDSSDDEIINRSARIDIANQIFGGRKSTGPEGAPTPPPAPPAPKSPAPVFKVPEGPADRNALLSSIALGARLKPTKTVDRSASQFAGTVLGDTAPPAHINAAPAPAPPSPPSTQNDLEGSYSSIAAPESSSNSRLSVDWYAGLASDTLSRSASTVTHEATISEEGEEEYVKLPNISVQPPVESPPETTPEPAADPLADVDLSTVHKVRSLYAYTGQRAEDLSFGENLIIHASPSKSGSDWWYGTVEKGGQKGFLPSSYVTVIDKGVQAKALYSYVGGSAEELPFSEGDILSIIDQSEGDWWKADKGGVVFIVPAAYLEVLDVGKEQITTLKVDSQVDGGSLTASPNPSSSRLSVDVNTPVESTEEDSDSDSDDDSAAYVSFDSDSESDPEEEDAAEIEKRKAEELEREAERARVLEAAGLVMKHDPANAPPVPPRRKKSVKGRPPRERRAPPPVPESRKRSASPPQSLTLPSPPLERDLPPTPTSPRGSILNSEADAWAKYEHFRQSSSSQNAATNRFSVVSMASDAPSSPRSTKAPSLSPSTTFKDGEPPSNHMSRSSGSFFSFLGRTTSQASASERRGQLVISGPINSTPDPVSRASSPAFGMSWSSLVDKTALEEIPIIERKRQESIFELISTEAAYVRDLQLIVEIFYAPLLPMLSEKELDGVFANIEEILLCNTTFLSSLEDRQKESRLYIDSVADLLEAHAPNFEIYANYCVGQGPAIKHLQALRHSRPDLDAHLTHLRNDPATRKLDLSSYLLVPMQRITKYPLLIKQILHNTESDKEKEREGLSHAKLLMEDILDRINEAIRDREGREILAEISQDLWVGQGRLDLTADTRYMGPRKLIKEGILLKKKRRLRAFLCTDIIVLTDASTRSLYRMPISLIEARAASTKDDLVFQLSLAYPRGGDALKLRATSAKECQEWAKAIEQAAGACRRVARRQ